MKNRFRTNQELIEEISALKQRIKELEQSESDRKKSEETLREECERLELAMDAGGHGFWDWHLDTNEAYFSPSYYTMLGYEPGEFPPNFQSWLNLLHPDDHREVVPRINRYVEKAQSYEEEFRLKCKDGSWRWISGRGKFFRKDAAAPYRAVGVHVDITERKQAEEALHIKDRAIASSFSASAISTFNGKLTYVNDAFLHMWGYTLQEALSINAADLASNKDEITHIINDIQEKGFSVGESIAKRNNGSLFNIQFSASLVTSSSGEPIAMLSTFVDITERKQAEETLRESETRWQFALEGAGDGVWDWNAVTNRVFFQNNGR